MANWGQVAFVLMVVLHMILSIWFLSYRSNKFIKMRGQLMPLGIVWGGSGVQLLVMALANGRGMFLSCNALLGVAVMSVSLFVVSTIGYSMSLYFKFVKLKQLEERASQYRLERSGTKARNTIGGNHDAVSQNTRPRSYCIRFARLLAKYKVSVKRIVLLYCIIVFALHVSHMMSDDHPLSYYEIPQNLSVCLNQGFEQGVMIGMSPVLLLVLIAPPIMIDIRKLASTGDILGLKASLFRVCSSALVSMFLLLIAIIANRATQGRASVLAFAPSFFLEYLVIELLALPTIMAIRTTRKKYAEMDWRKRQVENSKVELIREGSANSRGVAILSKFGGSLFGGSDQGEESRARELRRKAYMKKFGGKETNRVDQLAQHLGEYIMTVEGHDKIYEHLKQEMALEVIMFVVDTSHFFERFMPQMKRNVVLRNLGIPIQKISRDKASSKASSSVVFEPNPGLSSSQKKSPLQQSRKSEMQTEVSKTKRKDKYQLEMEAEAERIFRKYLAPNAEFEVNLPSATLEFYRKPASMEMEKGSRTKKSSLFQTSFAKSTRDCNRIESSAETLQLGFPIAYDCFEDARTDILRNFLRDSFSRYLRGSPERRQHWEMFIMEMDALDEMHALDEEERSQTSITSGLIQIGQSRIASSKIMPSES